ncbi:DUF6165 family protein [Alphaproteobacteria bacterium]|nr:DUF6165 family protein [Alphaproteobacteria bacterium]MDB4106630.1 DUF6165 family protein [bacterium]MDC0131490.1 DUF6165 family protein [Alphaproteobacteria bacterium]MDC0147421.1 DUF6165 family protein [Alphaproteobacteria bacterium]
MSNIQIFTEIGSGELIDKITILEIKSERIADEAKLVNVRTELKVLSATRDEALQNVDGLEALAIELRQVNEALWEIEDDIRACEAVDDFGQKFIDLARAVYITNDKRAALKKQINLMTGANIVEEKSYTEFG